MVFGKLDKRGGRVYYVEAKEALNFLFRHLLSINWKGEICKLII